MKYTSFLVIAVSLLSFNAHANFNDDIWALSEQSKKLIKSMDKKGLREFNKVSKTDVSKYTNFIHSLKIQQNKDNDVGGKVADGPILFVSFSMPIELIESLIEESTKYNIPLVIKGLINSDFKDTIEAIGKLKLRMEKENKAFSGVLIDPVWFDIFNIDKVPALVVTQRPENCYSQSKCKNQKYDVVYGNISIKKGLEIIAEKGEEASHIAKRYIEEASNND